jgi:predicted dehydrogenase
VRSGACVNNFKTRAQTHKKTSWRRTAPGQERADALNWRLHKETSTGLIGEIGSQQIDVMQWFLAKRPVSVTGFGGILLWQDGRDVEDTVQAVFQYEDGTSFDYEASIATSFDSELELLHGSDATIMLRGNKAWLFKEADSPLLGWEVYARKDVFFGETGISLAANASKSSKTEQSKGQDEAAYSDPPLYFAMDSFLDNAHMVVTDIEDFIATYDPKDIKGLKEYITGHQKNRKPAATFKDAFEASVITIKANEAVAKKGMVKFDPAWFEI